MTRLADVGAAASGASDGALRRPSQAWAEDVQGVSRRASIFGGGGGGAAPPETMVIKTAQPPGSELRVTTPSGQKMTVIVPDDYKPGWDLTVEVPSAALTPRRSSRNSSTFTRKRRCSGWQDRWRCGARRLRRRRRRRPARAGGASVVAVATPPGRRASVVGVATPPGGAVSRRVGGVADAAVAARTAFVGGRVGGVAATSGGGACAHGARDGAAVALPTATRG